MKRSCKKNCRLDIVFHVAPGKKERTDAKRLATNTKEHNQHEQSSLIVPGYRVGVDPNKLRCVILMHVNKPKPLPRSRAEPPIPLLNVVGRERSLLSSQLAFPPVIRAIGLPHDADAVTFPETQIAIPLAVKVIQRRDKHWTG